MRDVRASGVDIMTFGQYLRPTKNHLPVKNFHLKHLLMLTPVFRCLLPPSRHFLLH